VPLGRKDPRAEPDDDPANGPEEIDIAAAVRAAKTAAAHGRVPTAQETAKMGAFQLEQALAKVHAAAKEDDAPPPAAVEPPKAEEPVEAKAEPKEEAAKVEEVVEEKPKKAIPIPEPSEPGPMVSSIREPRVAHVSRGIPRSTIVLVFIAIALIGALYAWSRTLR